MTRKSAEVLRDPLRVTAIECGIIGDVDVVVEVGHMRVVTTNGREFNKDDLSEQKQKMLESAPEKCPINNNPQQYRYLADFAVCLNCEFSLLAHDSEL